MIDSFARLMKEDFEGDRKRMTSTFRILLAKETKKKVNEKGGQLREELA
jgi:hypothetical protein